MPTLGTLTIDTDLNTASLQADVARAAGITDAGARRMAKSFDDFGSKVESTFRRIFEVATGVGLANAAEMLGRKVVQLGQDMLKTGLEVERQEDAFNRMTAALGVNAQALESALEAASQGIADISDVMIPSVLALQEGLRPDQLVAFMRAAVEQSKLMGTSVVEAYNTITQAVIRQEERGFKAARIQLDVNSTLDAYAAKIGTTVDRLTELQRVQAIAEGALQKTERTTKAMSDAELTRSQQVEKLQTSLRNMYEQASKGFVDMAAGAAQWASDIAAAMKSAGQAIDNFVVKIPILGRAIAAARAAQQGSYGPAAPPGVGAMYGPPSPGMGGSGEQYGPPSPPPVKPPPGPSAADVKRAKEMDDALRELLSGSGFDAEVREAGLARITAELNRILDRSVEIDKMLDAIPGDFEAEVLAARAERVNEGFRTWWQTMLDIDKMLDEIPGKFWDDVDAAREKREESTRAKNAEIDAMLDAIPLEFDAQVEEARQKRIEDNLARAWATSDQISSLTAIVSSGLTGLIGTTENVGDAFARMAERIANSLLDTIIRGALKPAEEALSTFLSGLSRAGLSNLGGLFGTSATTAGTSAVDAIAIGGYGYMAEGGIVTRPGHAVIGEKGPEAVVPLDQYDRMRGGGGAMVIIEDHRGASAPDVQVRETERDGMQEIRVLIHDTVRGGFATGQYDRTLGSRYGMLPRGNR